MSFLSFRSVPISCRAPLNGGLVTIRSACSRSREHSADRQSPSPSSRESVLPGMQATHATGMPGRRRTGDVQQHREKGVGFDAEQAGLRVRPAGGDESRPAQRSVMVEQESYEHAACRIVAWTVDGPAGEGFRIVMRELLFDGVETRVELVVGIVLRVVQHP